MFVVHMPKFKCLESWSCGNQIWIEKSSTCHIGTKLTRHKEFKRELFVALFGEAIQTQH
ncbi:hypothetical protein Lalb_Chr00c30g0408371 [Lupinus albus]|uniref:Uncharacterized protein n=1 Tax=Lupinus albus TaxID=3870 RepID=A0A6A4NC84_LUPAL|nr:hypothetical protein Lalb_Chr00c30g0408371 [Lupinus albus]